MKITLTKSNCIQFLHEVVDDFGEAAAYYGLKMDKPGEEMAADDYELAWRKMKNGIKIVFESKVTKDA